VVVRAVEMLLPQLGIWADVLLILRRPYQEVVLFINMPTLVVVQAPMVVRIPMMVVIPMVQTGATTIMEERAMATIHKVQAQVGMI